MSVAAYASIDDLRSHLGKSASDSARTPDYVAKMLHPIPTMTSVDRRVFLLQQVAGKSVVEFGASGPMHEAIVKTAARVFGVDREAAAGVQAFDLDDMTQSHVPVLFDGWKPVPVDLLVCGEVLEHLSNPGHFLARLRKDYPGVPVVFTVPNAFSDMARRSVITGVEQVNKDHVCWYSYTTLRALLARVGYTIKVAHWYNGQPYLAEGLIVVTE